MNQNIDLTQLLQLATAQRQEQSSSKSLTYWELLSVVLVVLKAAGFVSLAWFWAFFPILIPYICYGLVMLTGFIIGKFIKR